MRVFMQNRAARHRRMFGVAAASAIAAFTAACSGAGGKSVPTPLAPGEVISVQLCGATTEPKGPCANFPDNSIQIRTANNSLPAICPCFNFSFLNQSLTDLGPVNGTTYEFTGFRPGNYQVTGQLMVKNVDFTFWHNTSTSTIGVNPASLQSLTGPAKSVNNACSVGYSTTDAGLPTTFSFQFSVAATSSGGSC